MREHGVLKRIMLVYDEVLRRMQTGEEVPPEPLAQSAKLIRSFVEDYHEKLEEDYLFPRFKKAGKLVDLVDVLVQQHQAGRRLTDITIQLATAKSLKHDDDRLKLANSLKQFTGTDRQCATWAWNLRFVRKVAPKSTKSVPDTFYFPTNKKRQWLYRSLFSKSVPFL